MDQKFKAPDATSLRRMTTKSIESLLETLTAQRAAKVKTIDEEIAFYEDLLEKKYDGGMTHA